MQLKSIKYSEYETKPKEWNLDELILDSVNLIVGKNASGKTRTLNLIYNLALLLCGERKPSSFTSANFNAIFKHENESYQYILSIKDSAVIKEELECNKNKWLTRHQDGAGKIFYAQVDREMDYQTPVSELAFTSRRDSLQHPFIEPLYLWAKSVHYYAFGTPLGRIH